MSRLDKEAFADLLAEGCWEPIDISQKALDRMRDILKAVPRDMAVGALLDLLEELA